jgi:hypothetical protein
MSNLSVWFSSGKADIDYRVSIEHTSLLNFRHELLMRVLKKFYVKISSKFSFSLYLRSELSLLRILIKMDND